MYVHLATLASLTKGVYNKEGSYNLLFIPYSLDNES